MMLIAQGIVIVLALIGAVIVATGILEILDMWERGKR